MKKMHWPALLVLLKDVFAFIFETSGLELVASNWGKVRTKEGCCKRDEKTSRVEGFPEGLLFGVVTY